jgi:hypothetical protein
MRTQAIPHADNFCAHALRIPYRRAHFPMYRPPLTRSELSGMGTFVSTASGAASAATGMPTAPPPSATESKGTTALLSPFRGVLTTVTALFKGANPLQVPAAQAEQIYEAAADNAYAVCKAGMVSVADAVAAMQNFLSQGISDIQGRGIGTAGQKGIANMTSVINAEIAAVQKLPAAATKALDLNVARSLYVSAGGWYPASLQAAGQLTDSWLASLGGSIAGAASSVASVLGVSGSSLGYLAIAAVAVLVLTSWSKP